MNGLPVGSSLLWIVLLAAFVVLIVIFRHRKRRTESEPNLSVEGEPSKSTILWGTPPHEMEGQISDELRGLAELPDTATTGATVSSEEIKAIADTAALQHDISTLEKVMVAESAEQPSQMQLSLRADFSGEDDAHVSQGAWDAKRECYELDEWVFKGKTLYGNAGIWSIFRDEELINDRRAVGKNLRPENMFPEFIRHNFRDAGEVVHRDRRYRILKSDRMQSDEAGAEFKATAWVEPDTGLLRKITADFFENGRCVAKKVSTFVYCKGLKISPPKWLNVDASGTIINEKVCPVEHA